MSISKIYAMSKKENVLSIRCLSHYKADFENVISITKYYLTIPAFADKKFSKIHKYNIGNIISKNTIRNISYNERRLDDRRR